MKQPLVDFSKGLLSICGIEQLSDEELKGQSCSGNHAKRWAACPFRVGCAAQGLKASSVRKSRIQSKRIVRGQRTEGVRCQHHALRLRAWVPPRHHLTTANDRSCKHSRGGGKRPCTSADGGSNFAHTFFDLNFHSQIFCSGACRLTATPTSKWGGRMFNRQHVGILAS
jgi:hypothetical protein